MFFRRCSYKNSCFSELGTTPVFLCQSNDLQLEIQQRRCYLKNVALDFVFGFEAMPHPSCYLTSIMDIKLTMGQLLLFFLCNFSSFFSYVWGIPVTNHFSLLLIDRYILAIQHIATYKEHLRYLFRSVAIFWTSSEALAPWS